MSYLAYVVLLALATALERTWPGWLLLQGQGPRVVLATVIDIISRRMRAALGIQSLAARTPTPREI